MMPYKRSFRFAMGLVVLLSVPFLYSCGKGGMPHANDPQRSFSWMAIQAKPYNKCLSFEGKLDGAYQNLDKVRLELAPITGPEDCLGCPFVPKEDVLLTQKEIGLELSDGTIAFSYCPKPAKAYRWRMDGISRYSRIPHAISNDQLTLFEDLKK